MKRFLTGIAMFTLVFSLAATPVFANGQSRGGGGVGTGGGTGICATCNNYLHDGACPYNVDCPNNGTCPQDGSGARHGTRPQGGSGAHHGGGHGSGRASGRGVHARNGSCAGKAEPHSAVNMWLNRQGNVCTCFTFGNTCAPVCIRGRFTFSIIQPKKVF